MKEELVGGGKGTGGQRPRKWNDKVPRGQCRKRCSGRNRAARRKRDGPVTKQQVLRMTSCFFDYPDSLIFLVLIWLIDGLTDQWTDGMIKSQLVLIFLIVKYYRYKEEEEEIEKERERERETTNIVREEHIKEFFFLFNILYIYMDSNFLLFIENYESNPYLKVWSWLMSWSSCTC